ncbi:diaminopropionate ammonia-lyase [Granulosicoccus sp. 3-233]|uniref:diaminopropionate ammonia-lyase n=1 Tax=Granulosicoccus sp. 3-233 TaxID=3417969 RepID=UPI003D3354A3
MTTSSNAFQVPQGESFELLRNRLADSAASWSAEQDAVLSDAGLSQARTAISSWPGYSSTPLLSLPALANLLGVGNLHYKDESSRFGLGSFKALGGAYAVGRLLQRCIAAETGGAEPDMQAILNGEHVNIVSRMTVCCATDGNHGRSVAWGAERFGCTCVIFIHATVSEARRQAIERYGARVIRTEGNYDDSVRAAQQAASDNDWFVVSDTSYPGYVDIPRDVMQGYELMAAEADEQLASRPTHVFIQTGVGGVAAAVAAYFTRRYGKDRPQIILADPDQSACWLATLRAGEPTAVVGDLDTVMAGLACGEVSLLAWTILRQHADAVVAIPDSGVAPMMRQMAFPLDGDPAAVAGESAVAGMLALALVAQVAETREALHLSSESSVLVFGTEGDTDPELYQALVGKSGDEVRQQATC